MSTAIRVLGVPECKAALLSIPRKLRKNVLLSALKDAAKPVSQAVAAATPVLSTRAILTNRYRKPGTLRKAIGIKVSRLSRQAGNVGVYVTVRQLPGNKWKTVRSSGIFGDRRRRVLVKRTKRSAHNPNDPFYGRFVQWGTKFMIGRHFFERGVPKLNESLTIFERKLGPVIERLNANGLDEL